MNAQSVTDIEEKALAQWLFTGPTVTISVSLQLGLGQAFQLGLALPTTALFPDVHHPGDIDVLIQHDESATRCTAIEFKRVKVKAETFQNDSPNKIAALAKGVRQANDLYELGFSMTVLLIAIVTDGRTQTRSNFAHRGPTVQHLRKIRNFRGFGDLRDGVGLAFVEITQPVDKPIEMAGGIGAYTVKLPTIQPQHAELALRVRAYFTSLRSG